MRFQCTNGTTKIMSTDTEGQYQQAYERERQARKIAETELHSKTREVYDNLQKIQAQNQSLDLQTREFRLLAEVTNFVKEDLSFKEKLEKYLESVSTLLSSPYALVYLRKEDSDVLYASSIVYPKDDFPEVISRLTEKTDYIVGKSLPGKVLETQQMLLWKAAENSPSVPMRLTICEELGLAGSLSVPILQFGDIIAIAEFGVYEFDSVEASSLDKIEASATQMGSIIERQLVQKTFEKNYAKLNAAHEELKNAQNQLVQSEKMASLGQIAAGVAHEINNPIGFVMSNMSTMQEYVSVYRRLLEKYEELENHLANQADSEINETSAAIQTLKKQEDLEFINEDVIQMLDDSSSGLVRVKEIVANLKTFAHADDGVLEEHDINENLENTLKVIWNELKYTVEVHKDYGDLPKVRCRIGQLGQVFMNLLVNAKDACGEKGEIRIKTRLLGDKVEISITDNGQGIPPEKVEKIFDPFFTTKPVGKGTGLGLSVSYGIIEKHGGSIKVESTVGEGTSFRVSIPLS